MLSLILAIIFFIVTIISGETTAWNKSLGDVTISIKSLEDNTIRQGKFFPLFSVVRFANSECSASNNFQGTCFTARECKSYGGTSYGTCAGSLGVCCVCLEIQPQPKMKETHSYELVRAEQVQLCLKFSSRIENRIFMFFQVRKSCGTTTNMNNTYFVNPGYPMTYTGGETCTLEVFRCNSDICQLRIDFLDFSLGQPNANGVCDHDFLLVTRGSTRVPRICGDNSNQHVYVDFNGANPISISLVTDSDFPMDRRWNLRIQQIACDSPWRAPNGCLQYLKAVTGTVSSFNYGTAPNPRASLGSTMGTRQMQYLNYGVCVRMASGYCTIEWSQADSLSFAISGDTGVLDPNAVSDFAESGVSCDHNFVIIPNPSVAGVPVNVDRFCGNGFVTTTSSAKPFVMYVVTNPEAAGVTTDFENRGFIMRYRQIPCTL